MKRSDDLLFLAVDEAGGDDTAAGRQASGQGRSHADDEWGEDVDCDQVELPGVERLERVFQEKIDGQLYSAGQ